MILEILNNAKKYVNKRQETVMEIFFWKYVLFFSILTLSVEIVKNTKNVNEYEESTH